jgi:hypothetical protein
LLYFEEFVKIFLLKIRSFNDHEEQVNAIIESFDEKVGKLKQEIADLKMKIAQEDAKLHDEFDEKLENIKHCESETKVMEEKFEEEIESMM